MKKKILDLEALCVQLRSIITTLEKSNDLSEIKKMCEGLLKLFQEPSNFYFQFIHGGCATGFRYSSHMILVNSHKIIATVEANMPQTIPELKMKLLSNISEIIRDVAGNSHFEYPQLTYDIKPPSWVEASSYFISYAHADNISQTILARIKSVLGYTVNLWLDSTDLKRHQQVPKALSDAITNSEASLLIVSKNYLKSKWCNEEWQALFMKRLSDPNYRLYLIRIDNVVYPPFLSTFNYTDCRSYPKPYAKVELGKLIHEIEEYERDYQFYKCVQKKQKIR
jgi:hypothetical protein